MKYIICILSLLFLVEGAAANLSARPIVVELAADGSGRADILVGNTGQRTQYLSITALKMVEPGASPERYLRSPDPAEVGLLVAPRRLVLQPEEEKVIRIILFEDEIISDAAWRVRIEPVIGRIESTGSVAVTSVGYDALVFARPAAPAPNLTARRDGKRLTIQNTGNTNTLLHSGKQCRAEAQCDAVTGKRLWPGMSWTIELPHSGEVAFVERGPGEERRIVF